jgi:hypothetical protein
MRRFVSSLSAALLAPTIASAHVSEPVQVPPRPRLDVAFVLDTTGSMGDEIDVVKEKLVSIARKLSSGQPAPDVRFAVVAFRDKGDAYVTKAFDFERDIKKVQAHILGLQADGGGDEPEDIAAALHATLKLDWDSKPEVTRVAFLVGDAGPHAYAKEPTWEHAIANFRDRKISIDTVGCSGLAGPALSVFKNIAERTTGKFEELTYRRVERLADGRSRTVLTKAGETYVADGELSDADWKRGAEVLEKEGRVKRGPATPLGSDGLMASRMGGGGRGMGIGAAAKRPAAPSAAPVATSEMKNNLDEEISSRLVEKAKAAGTAYAK